ncbi:hypothetical protein PRZ48_012424 [Zasmidium cellare]|uniref:Methyltransferase domain-containing protein n=1 Tax=Zasmidium cellare TaxID=395010 RepID=A0ABR0E4U5_ZASCE|nr:hypothetical protein PRZ48_012424 [Zasmidium cellare]
MSVPADNYIISRDANEAERLVVQHKCMISCQGYYLHPEVKPSATAPRIADVATGTGIWLCELAPAYPQAELHGFDISDKMFPSQDSLPSNVKLHTADIKKPLDEAWHGYFDVVNIRLIQAAMRVEEWGPLVRNLSTLLKPGGWLQWYEDDRAVAVRHCFRPAAPIGATELSLHSSGKGTWQPPPHLATLASFNRLAMDDERALAMNYGYMNLDVLMKDPAFGNLENVACDGFIVDRHDDGGKLRKAYAVMGISAVRNMLKWREESGQKVGNVSSDEWSDQAMKDIENGAHFVSRATCFIGRKKRQE